VTVIVHPAPDEQPLPGDDRFSVELTRFLEGRVDPGRNVHPPGNPPLDVLACLQAQDELDRIVG
jgi:hypothetical protein